MGFFGGVKAGFNLVGRGCGFVLGMCLAVFLFLVVLGLLLQSCG